MSDILKEINDRYGDDALMTGAEFLERQKDIENRGKISTGSIALDRAMGGGVPRGRLTEFHGKDGTGKSTVCYHVIANAQNYGRAAYIDVEHAVDLGYAGLCGVNTEDLLVARPDTGEQALEIVEAVARSAEFSVVVLDSIGALLPTKEAEGDMGDAPMASQARLVSQALRKLIPPLSKTNTAFVVTNQLREDMNSVRQPGRPPKEYTPGGRKLLHDASVRVRLIKLWEKAEDDRLIRQLIGAKVVKNKVGPPLREAEFMIFYNRGIDRAYDTVEVAIDTGVIEQKGAWYYFGDHKWNGKNRVHEVLLADKELENRIREELKDD